MSAKVQVHRQFFKNKAEVFRDMAENGLWPITYVSKPCGEHPLHMHDADVHAYVMSSATYFRDGVTGEKLPVRAGDKIVIPEGYLHSEGVITEDTIFIAAIPEARNANEILRFVHPDGEE